MSWLSKNLPSNTKEWEKAASSAALGIGMPVLRGAHKKGMLGSVAKKGEEGKEEERIRPKTKAQEGVIDYTQLQKTLKQMQSIKGKAINPEIMKSLLGGAIKGQIEPAIAREEKALDRAMQQKALDQQKKQFRKQMRVEEEAAEMAFVGDVIGAVGAATILCTELNRQGLLDIHAIERANIYRRKHISKEVYEGYLMWATPLVEIMKKSILVTKLVCLFWKPLTYELASRENERKGNLVGKIAYGILSRFSRVVYFFNKKGVVKWQAL